MFVKPGSISPLIDLKPIFILRYLNSSLMPTSIASLKLLITPFIFEKSMLGSLAISSNVFVLKAFKLNCLFSSVSLGLNTLRY